MTQTALFYAGVLAGFLLCMAIVTTSRGRK